MRYYTGAYFSLAEMHFSVGFLREIHGEAVKTFSRNTT